VAIDARNTFVYSPLDLVTNTGSSTGAAIAVASVAAAGTAGVFNICKRVQINMAVSSGASQVPYVIQLLHSASNGTVLAQWVVTPSPAASGIGAPSQSLDFDNLHIIPPAANAAMFLQAAVNASASTVVGLQLQTYQFPKANFKTVTNAA
jgi:hypothetical protein